MQIQLLITLLIAIFLGGLIGLDREIADKPAGLRTHMLVAGASALLVGLSDDIITAVHVSDSLIRSDPIRIVEAIITGITFLGAGTIIRYREEAEVEGLTTAASLFFAVSIGITVALSLYVLAVGATFITVLILRGVKWAEDAIQKSKDQQREKKE